MKSKMLISAAGCVALIQATHACPVNPDWSGRSVGHFSVVDDAIDSAIAAAAPAPLGPNITSWKFPAAGAKAGWGRATLPHDSQINGYMNALETDVQSVQYNGSTIYIAASGVPSSTIGPWYVDTTVTPAIENPNLPKDYNFVFRMTRNPRKKDSAHVATPNGPIGLLVNGVPVFNAGDATFLKTTSAGKSAFWHYNALEKERPEWVTDGFGGHPDAAGPGTVSFTVGATTITKNLGRFHVHEYPKNFDSVSGTEAHSPLLGFALDGFPIYGPYGYANADGTGGIDLLQSSYRIKRIHARRQIIGGTVVAGPTIDADNPLGTFLEDYEYLSGLGDLDQHNARWTVTPEYPDGTWAYFMSMNLDTTGALIPAYPYTIGPTFAGEVTGAIIADGLIPSGPFTTVASRSVPESGLAAAVAPLAALLRRSRPRGRIVPQRFP